MISVTIALTRYQEPDELLRQCLESIAEQQNVRARVCLPDQSFHQQTKNLCESLSSDAISFEYHLISAQGCAHARNTAVGLCQTDILLWTDPDVLLLPDWALHLSGALDASTCDITGGKIVPQWHAKPRWYSKSNIMADHYSLIDLGEDIRATDRIIGGSMGLHIGRLGKLARFDERLGRKDGTLLGGVDAEFCERALKHGLRVRYVGRAVAKHQIPAGRTSLKWIVRKFYYGGVSRGMRGGRPRAMNKKRIFADYIVLGAFIPFYLAGLLNSKVRRKIVAHDILRSL